MRPYNLLKRIAVPLLYSNKSMLLQSFTNCSLATFVIA